MNIPLRVLIVEDSTDDADLLLRALRRGGFDPQHRRVDSAAGVNQAMDEQAWDIVIADYVMPRFSGLAALELMKERGLDLPVIIMSGKVSEEVVVSAMKAGAHDCILKDNLVRLVPAIERELKDTKARQAQQQAKEIERERDELRKAIAAQEKVLGVVSHELRTPLAGARLMAEFLLTDTTRDPLQAITFLQSIHDEIVRMSAMVDDLLEVARLNSGAARWNWESVSVAAACAEALDAVRFLVDREKVQLIFDATPAEFVMQGDADAIRRLVLNLTNNAAKFTASGLIRVRASLLRADDENWVQLEIHDTGQGMSPEVLARLGDAFILNTGTVGHGRTQGVGLGLAICKGIVAAHGGTMTYSSAPGQGTKVIARLRADLTAPIGETQENNIIRVTTDRENLAPQNPVATRLSAA
jgi:signal transduction histidine kinase